MMMSEKYKLWQLLCQKILRNLVGLAELESATSPLSGVRSNQLSYRPITNGTTIVQEIDLDSKRKFNFAA